MDHRNVLKEAASAIAERGKEYGSEDASFQRCADLATIVLNKSISKYDVAMILAMNQLALLQENRTKSDTYVQPINYLAFAAQFASQPASIETAVEDDAKRMADNIAKINLGAGAVLTRKPSDVAATYNPGDATPVSSLAVPFPSPH